MENSLYFDATHNFSVWLRTGSHPADINRLQSLTEQIPFRHGDGVKDVSFTVEDLDGIIMQCKVM